MKRNILFILIGLLSVFIIYAFSELMLPLPFGSKSIEFEIKNGMTFRQVVDALSQKGMLRDKLIFLMLGRVTGIDRKVRAGYYNLWGTMSPLDIFNTIRGGKIVEYEITVVPGDSLLEIADKFSGLGIAGTDKFYEICRDRNFLNELDIDGPSLEGYIFPDTYIFPKGLDAREVILIMVDRLREKYDDALTARAYELGLTEKDVLIMASIIEKEAVVDDERPVIAAVYYNRLKKNMPLQADPTAIYGVKSSKEKITKEDLMRKTGYNTYIFKGMPPGPIASPGLKSINAALYPANVPYLFFVSNNDGTHNFSVTVEGHNEAVRSYRDKKRVKDRG